MNILSVVGSAWRQLSALAMWIYALAIFVGPWLVGPASAQEAQAWAALAQGGHVMLMRHATAPGATLSRGTDPAGFDLEDCTTQRNLDDIGRRQAMAAGDAVRRNGIKVQKVLSSPWCRCRETAELMNVGPAEISRTFSSLVLTRPNAADHERAMRELVSTWRGPGTLLVISHSSNIKQLTGRTPEQAETAVLKPEPGTRAGFSVAGSIDAPK